MPMVRLHFRKKTTEATYAKTHPLPYYLPPAVPSIVRDRLRALLSFQRIGTIASLIDLIGSEDCTLKESRKDILNLPGWILPRAGEGTGVNLS